MARCTSHRKDGLRCTKRAAPGRATCSVHGPDGNETPGAPRPGELTSGDLDAKLERMRRGFLEGGTQQGAARSIGIHPGTLGSWLQRGRRERAERAADDYDGPAEQSPYERLEEMFEDARAELVAELAAQYQAIAIDRGDLDAIRRRLASLDPDHWAERREIRHGGIEGAPPIATTGPPPTTIVHLSLGGDIDAEAEAIAADDEG